MQPTCETASESLEHPQSNIECDRISDLEPGRISKSESIKDCAYNKTDYSDSSGNESTTVLDEQLKQLNKENRFLTITLEENIDNLEVRIGDNNRIRRQQAEIHPWLDYIL